MKIHLVGGFLGSGKTTSIVAACKALAENGARIGVVTNDQGRYLVDTAFVRAKSLPAVEVSGGCFCCRFPDFRKMISEVDARAHPDHVFAEAVGSCADIVATVIRPSLLGEDEGVSSFSVFADVRLLGLWLKGHALPFSDEVTYLFGKQLEEGELLIVNKSDLVSAEDGSAVLRALETHFPGKRILLQSAFSKSDIDLWLAQLMRKTGTPASNLDALDLDYPRYATAEASLAWFDAEVHLSAGASSTAEFVGQIVAGIASRAKSSRRAIGHLKLLVSWHGGSHEIGITGSDSDLGVVLPDMGTGEADLVVNARVQCPPEELSAMVHASLDEVAARFARDCAVASEEGFRPSYPFPTHRILD